MKVKIKDHYPNADYDLYLDRMGNKTKATKSTYKPGDIVYNTKQNTLGIVLGCICESLEELRTDADGMTCYDDIRAYEELDEIKPKVGMANSLRKVFQSDEVIDQVMDNITQELQWDFERLVDKILTEYDDDDTLQDIFDESTYSKSQNLTLRKHIAAKLYINLAMGK